ncbi:PAS domain-containing protein [Halobacteria archaeon AArc-curdl1]|uniref:histidine kinase n=1 Tax=Natronosalvus hydrolyticus TaxID=2979988 RepID=A0AAP2Z7K1_9EURY|nr:PAS domain-containing protein [Halobacteria archaeon AArc-curdl1]
MSTRVVYVSPTHTTQDETILDALESESKRVTTRQVTQLSEIPKSPECIICRAPAVTAASLSELVERFAPTPVIVVLEPDRDTLSLQDVQTVGVADYIRLPDLESDDTRLAHLRHRLGAALERLGLESRSSSPSHGASESATVDTPACESKQYRPDDPGLPLGPTALLERVPAPLFITDSDGVCLFVNDAMCTFTGYDRDIVCGEPVATFVGDGVFERASSAAVDAVFEADREPNPVEFSLETADGTRRVGESMLAPILDDGAIVGTIGVAHDISARKRREQELVQFESILETAPVGMFVLDSEATISWANRAFVDSLAEPADDIVGQPFPKLVERGYFKPEDVTEYVENVRHLLSSGTNEETLSHDVEFHTPDNNLRQYDAHLGLLPLEDGEFQGTVHAFRDVTEQRHSQRELERQNERLEQFASLVSHDLRNPLNVAQGYLELLETDCESGALEELQWSLGRMEALIGDVLELARQGQTVGERTHVPISALATGSWDAVDTGDATLKVTADGTLSVDEGRVRALFENLFRNAIEHGAAEGKTLTITVGQLGSETRGDGFFVEDDGRGFARSPEELFELGATTNPDGTGFGLRIVEQIADAHGWSIHTTASDAGGARFEFYSDYLHAESDALE